MMMMMMMMMIEVFAMVFTPQGKSVFKLLDLEAGI
jgi:hypothetical protein